MSDTLYRYLIDNQKNVDYIYEENYVKKCVIWWSRGIKESDKRRAKDFLYNVFSRIIVKNINNYFNLLQKVNAESKNQYTHDDMVSECYLILETCVNKCKLSKCRSFMWYFNKSLSHGFYRKAEKIRKRGAYFVNQKNADINLYDSMGFYKEKEHEILLDDFGLKGFERQYLLSVKTGETSKDFKQKFKMDNSRFNQLVSSVRKKLKQHYEEINS